MQDWAFSSALAAAKRGDRESAQWLYERFRLQVHGQVRGLCNSYLRRHYDTLDLSQSVFSELLRDMDGLEDRGEHAFENLLRMKVRNKIRTKYRKHLDRDGNRRGVPLTADVPQPASCPVMAAADAETRAKFAIALARLDPKRRELVRLRLEQGLSYSAIARRLDYPTADAARMQHARALLSLQGAWSTR